MPRRITPFYLANEIEKYNGYLQQINFPWRFHNNPNNGWQQLELIRHPETSTKRIETGTSRECVEALWKSYSALYHEAMNGELIITHVEDLGTPNSPNAKRETGNNRPQDYASSEFKPDEYRSAHRFVQNVMQSCSYWQIWYTLNGVYYTQTLNQSWK